MKKGEIWWASLPEPRGSEPGFRRPVLIISSNAFNSSRISTVLVAVITKNINLASAPGNVLIKKKVSKLNLDSVVNVSQILTIDKGFLTEKVSTLKSETMGKVNEGLRLVLDLGV